MGILVNEPSASDGSGNQLIAWANTRYLLQTRVPGLEFGTWRNPACAAFRTYQSMDFGISKGTQCIPLGFSLYGGYRNLLAERIRVWILGHPGRILRSYLHDLCDHGIQTCYRGGRGLRIWILLRTLFGCYNTQNYRVAFTRLVPNPSWWEWNAEFIILCLPPMMKSIFYSFVIAENCQSSGARPTLPMGVAPKAMMGCLQPIIG
jgi:hypothetical protein